LADVFKETEAAALQTVQVIDYSDLAVFDAFNDSYLFKRDYRGLLTPPDQEPGRNILTPPDQEPGIGIF
jgi:hypothetical protein